MELVQLTKMSTEIFFFKNYEENKVGRLVADLFLFLKKASNKVNSSGI